MIGYYVVNNPKGKYCKDRFFKDYKSFEKWLRVYALGKDEWFKGIIEPISDPDEYNKMCEAFKK